MKAITFNKAFCFFLFLTSFYVLPVMASDESFIKTLSGKIKKKDSCVVTDDKFISLPLPQWNQLTHLSVENIVSFELRNDTSLFYQKKPFTCTLNITIKYFSSWEQQKPTEIKDISLVVKYDTASGKYLPVRDTYIFKNAHKVIVVVNSISSPEWGKELPPVFRIRNQILVKRKYPFIQEVNGHLKLTKETGEESASNTKGMASRVSGNVSVLNDKLLISWDPADFPNYEEYDVEWTYIDRQSTRGKDIELLYGGLAGPYTIPDNLVEEWMRNDNSRVTVNTSQYSIDLAYPEGFLLMRVRGAYYQVGTNLRLTSAWQFKDDNANISCVSIASHEPDLTWQFSASFAEEGKRKEIISYFDGTLRSREAVTINNSDDKATVAETIYDNMGRPAITILPAPIASNQLKFYSEVNKNSNGDAYSASDLTVLGVSNCTIGAGVLSQNSGAGRYYSPANDFLNATNFPFDYISDYVPNSQGYPFSVTQYVPDNTGRIRRQGGVGPEFQIGSGHETRYFYGKPYQKELDRLFGSEAGNSSHYQKNMVVDPNGQISVQYIDPEGHTIATALAGGAPQNLDELSSIAGASTPFNEQLIKSGDFRKDPGQKMMQASAVFTTTVTGKQFKVNYNITPLSLITNFAGGQICSNCYYVVEVSVKDDCGAIKATKTSNPFLINDITCHTNPQVVNDFVNVDIDKIGEYTVTYTLRLNDDVIKFQADHYIQTNTDLKQVIQFIDDELAETELLGCYSECSTCLVKLGSPSEFSAKMTALIVNIRSDKYPLNYNFDPNGLEIQAWITNTYDQLYNNCIAMQASCKPNSPCELKLSMLKRDVVPGGQYALYTYDENNETYAYIDRQISVLRFYNMPASATYNLSYVNESGATVLVRDLSETDFIREYINHPEWADHFVLQHIEYCSYIWCKDQSNTSPLTNNEVSYTFDAGLIEVTDGAIAESKGYFNRTNYLTLLNADPFFNGGRGSSYLTQMGNDLLNLSTVIHIVMRDNSNTVLPGKNILELVDWELYCKPTNAAATDIDFINSWTCSPASDCRSKTMEWEIYRNYYLKIKGKYLEWAKQALLPDCKNCFIGKDPIAAVIPDLGEVNNPPPPEVLPCPVMNDFYYDYEVYMDYYNPNYPYEDASVDMEVYYVHAAGVVNQPVTVRVEQVVDNTGYDPYYYYFDVTILPGNDRVHIGRKVLQYFSYYGTYSYYFYNDYSVIDVSCAPPINEPGCHTISGPTVSKSVSLSGYWATSATTCNTSDEMLTARWTNSGVWHSVKSLLQFDLSSIPSGATITSAQLSLYAHASPVNGNHSYPQYGSNSSYLERITSSWNCGLTYNQIPSSTSSNRVQLATSTYQFQDYTNINVLGMVNDMRSNGNYGFLFRPVDESNAYRSMIFYSPTTSNVSKRPKLEVCYTLNLSSSTCAEHPDAVLYGNKIRIFNDYVNEQGYVNFVAGFDTNLDEAASLIAVRYEAQQDLVALKQNWEDRLNAVVQEETERDVANLVTPRFSSITTGQVSTLANALFTLAARHIAIADKNNIRSASSLPLSEPAPHTFREVFTTIIGSTLMAKGFGPELLEYPFPHDKTPVYANPNVIEITSDIQANLTALHNRFLLTSLTSIADFHIYLGQQLGSDYQLTEEELEDLWDRSNNSCRLLNKPLLLPAAMVIPAGSIGYSPSIDCAGISAKMALFTADYPDVVAGTKLYKTLLTNYLNLKLGYSLTYSDYDEFLTLCQSSSTAVLYNKAILPLIQEDDFSCAAEITTRAFEKAAIAYEQYIELEIRKFRNAYVARCLENPATASVEGEQWEYHYTLYYYDQSGNLVKTISPEGVKLLTDAEIARVQEYRADNLHCDASELPVSNSTFTYNILSEKLRNYQAQGMEMWMYSEDRSDDKQVRFITPDQKYLYQAAIHDQKLWVEYYNLDQSDPDIEILQSRKVVADLSSLPPLQEWTHLQVQSPAPLLGNPLSNTALTEANYFSGEPLSLMTASDNFTMELWVNPSGTITLPTESTYGYGGFYGQEYAIHPAYFEWGYGVAAGISVGTNGINVIEHGEYYCPALLSWSGSLSGWTHIAVVYDNKTPSLYVNGTHVRTGLTSDADVVYPSLGFYGGYLGSVTGAIDEIRIWDYARSGGQVSSAYNTMVSPLEPGLAGYWPVSAEDGVVLKDISPNHQDLLLPLGFGPSNFLGTAPAITSIYPAAGELQVFIDGHLLTNITPAPAYPFAWQLNNITGKFFRPADNITNLKHLRVYDRPASGPEVLANFKNKCMSPEGALSVGGSPLMHWGRFNVPVPGSPGTDGPGSTVEKALRFLAPAHNLPVNYAYNSLDQVSKQSSPDAGISEFWYDRLGRLSISQNAEQLSPAIVDGANPANRFSYTRYDALGRITETGEKLSAASVDETLARDNSLLQSWLNSGTNRQVTVTAYDKAPSWAPGTLAGTQFNLRKRVAATALLSTGSDPAYNRLSAAYYSYDMIGNVHEQVQENAALSAKEASYITGSTGLKHIKYEYDLVSGKVNKLLYQDGKWDQFYYKYVYDADNRLSDAYTSRYNYPADAILSNWIREAHYNYYLHGPLARMELGKNNVQGVDYAYTLQGWLKGVNSHHLGGGDDMSGDGKSGSPFALHGRDVFAFTLGYYANDYSAIGSSAGAFGLAYQAPAASTPGEPGKSLFNGNISHATYAVAGIDNGATAGHSYKYDQLNRLTQMGRHSIVPASTNWDNSSLLAAYKEQISYDANGNIKNYLRNGANSSGLPLAMDDMTYGYHLDVNGRLTSNRLRHVKDPVNAGNYTEDIDNQADDTYVYDKIGNLIADNTVGDEKLDHIQWTIYGKIGSIVKHNGTTINYGYDPSGNRVTKQVTNSSGTVSSYYVRDAQGNVLGLYDDHTSGTAGYSWKEQHLYGSSRLGIFNPNRFVASGQPLANDLYDALNDPADNGIEGLRAYELSNHLGNVLATISDRQIAVSSGGSLIDYYNAELLSAQDYYAFGMLVPGRKFGVSGRYGFNGKENDNEVKGEGNQQDYGMRIYDPRVGRFLSVDPLSKEYAWNSPYSYAENDVIRSIDLDGLEKQIVTNVFFQDNNNKWNIGGGSKTEQVDNPFKLGGGTLVKEYRTYNLGNGQNKYQFIEYYIPPRPSFVFSCNTPKLPQVQVFGSGSSVDGGYGSKPDYSRPIFSFDYAKFQELFDLINVGTQGPDRIGPMRETTAPESGSELTKKIFDYINDQKNQKEASIEKDPVIKLEIKQGKWEYYERGKRSGYISGEKDQIIPGTNGERDTIKRIKYTQPSVPKKDIPKKD